MAHMNDNLNDDVKISATSESDDEAENSHQHTDEQDSHSHHDHDIGSVGVAVVTVSSSRSLDNDPAGDAIAAAFDADGHTTVTREMLRDSYDRIQTAVESLSTRADVDCVVTSGGTGVTPDDVTVEAVRDLFDKALPGFGELFRTLSYDEVGTRVVGTRAIAGVVDATPVFCLPGSENAARLGAGEIIVPEVAHLSGLAARDENGDDQAN
jgi:molybdenum cofactor biosynthesis protein B